MNERTEPESKGPVWAKVMMGASKALVGVVAFVATLAAAPFFPFVRENLLSIGLAAALLVTIVTLVLVESRRSREAAPSGVVAALAHREDLDRAEILRQMKTAKTIEMAGLNLRNPWFRRGSPFDEMIRARLRVERDFRLRAVIADPRSDGLKSRERREDGRQSGRLVSSTEEALCYLGELLKVQPEPQIEVRLVDGESLYFSMVLVQERAFVTLYRATRTGNMSPALIVQGPNSPLLGVFRQEFEDLWKAATPHVPPS